jgi:hypothetical protein
MTRDIVMASISVLAGGFFAVHCPQAALREYRAGIARGRVQDFRRETSPISFWLTICATAFAGVLGLGFLLYGLARIAVEWGIIG